MPDQSTYTPQDAADVLSYILSNNWVIGNTGGYNPSINHMRNQLVADYNTSGSTGRRNSVRTMFIDRQFKRHDIAYNYIYFDTKVRIDILAETPKMLFLITEEVKRCCWQDRRNPDPLTASDPHYYHTLDIVDEQDLSHEKAKIYHAIIDVELHTYSKPIIT